MMLAEKSGSPEHPFNGTEDPAQHHNRELLPSMSQAGNGWEERVLISHTGNYPAFTLLLLREDGERAAGCSCGALPLLTAASHSSQNDHKYLCKSEDQVAKRQNPPEPAKIPPNRCINMTNIY